MSRRSQWARDLGWLLTGMAIGYILIVAARGGLGAFLP